MIKLLKIGADIPEFTMTCACCGSTFLYNIYDMKDEMYVNDAGFYRKHWVVHCPICNEACEHDNREGV